MSPKIDISLTLNGIKKSATVRTDMSALDMLRDVIGLTGTKYGCGEGECGACTILMDGISVNACLLFAVDCHDRNIVTVEGLAANSSVDVLRAAFVEHGAVQCGFCTPGMVVQASHLLDTHPDADEDTIKRGIEGNICRCTGYKKIVEAIASVSQIKHQE